MFQIMKKEDIESILMTNRYLTICRNDPEKYAIFRMYLNHKIKKALNRRISNPISFISCIKIIFAGLLAIHLYLEVQMTALE